MGYQWRSVAQITGLKTQSPVLYNYLKGKAHVHSSKQHHSELAEFEGHSSQKESGTQSPSASPVEVGPKALGTD
jgi:hypothetical protein